MNVDEYLAGIGKIIGVGTSHFVPERFVRWDEECPTAMMACWAAAAMWDANADAVWDSITSQIAAPEAVCWVLEYVRNIGESCREDIGSAARLMLEVGQRNDCQHLERHVALVHKANKAHQDIDDVLVGIEVVDWGGNEPVLRTAKDGG